MEFLIQDLKDQRQQIDVALFNFNKQEVELLRNLIHYQLSYYLTTIEKFIIHHNQITQIQVTYAKKSTTLFLTRLYEKILKKSKNCINTIIQMIYSLNLKYKNTSSNVDLILYDSTYSCVSMCRIICFMNDHFLLSPISIVLGYHNKIFHCWLQKDSQHFDAVRCVQDGQLVYIKDMCRQNYEISQQIQDIKQENNI